MVRQIRVRGVRRKQIDEDKLAMAFLMLAKVLTEQSDASESESSSIDARVKDDAEAA